MNPVRVGGVLVKVSFLFSHRSFASISEGFRLRHNHPIPIFIILIFSIFEIRWQKIAEASACSFLGLKVCICVRLVVFVMRLAVRMRGIDYGPVEAIAFDPLTIRCFRP